MLVKHPFRSISVKNILSFGTDGIDVELRPLNVLVGPNGSGKSNFLEVFRLLQSTPHDLTRTIIDGGGMDTWVWNGKPSGYPDLKCGMALFDNLVDNALSGASQFDHELSVYGDTQIIVHKEIITKHANGTSAIMYGGPRRIGMMVFHPKSHKYIAREINSDYLNPDQSILAQRNDPDTFGYITALRETYTNIHIYGAVIMGRGSPARRPVQADLDSKALFEDASNLALVLNDLQNRPAAIKEIVHYVKLFNPRITNIITRVTFGTILLYIEEMGLEKTVPATRLSDGTLRFLALLTVLCHPEPPPLICIEEPELGMHPDIIPTIGDLLIEASTRTQLIVTTHSDLLLSRFQDIPEAVLVCERAENGTTMCRPDPDLLSERLRDKSLGEIWLQGAIGGTRW